MLCESSLPQSVFEQISGRENSDIVISLLAENDSRIARILSRLILHKVGYQRQACAAVYEDTIHCALSRSSTPSESDFLCRLLHIARERLAIYNDMITREDTKLTALSELFEIRFPDSRPMNENDMTVAQELIGAIPGDCRDYFLFREILGLEYHEMADYFRVDEHTIRRKVVEAKILLTAICRQYVIEALTKPDDELHYLELSRRIYEKAFDQAPDDEPAGDPSQSPLP